MASGDDKDAARSRRPYAPSDKQRLLDEAASEAAGAQLDAELHAAAAAEALDQAGLRSGGASALPAAMPPALLRTAGAVSSELLAFSMAQDQKQDQKLNALADMFASALARSEQNSAARLDAMLQERFAPGTSPPAVAGVPPPPAAEVSPLAAAAAAQGLVSRPAAGGSGAHAVSRFAVFAGKDYLALVLKNVALNGGVFLPPFIAGEDPSAGFSLQAARAGGLKEAYFEFGITLALGKSLKIALVEGTHGSAIQVAHWEPQIIGGTAAKLSAGLGDGAVDAALALGGILSEISEGQAAAAEPLPVAGDMASTVSAICNYQDMLMRLYPDNSDVAAQFKAWRRYLPALHRQAPAVYTAAVLQHMVNVALARWAADCAAWMDGQPVPRLDAGTTKDWEGRIDQAFIAAAAPRGGKEKKAPAAAPAAAAGRHGSGRDISCRKWAASGTCAFRDRGSCQYEPCASFLAAGSGSTGGTGSTGGGGRGGGGAVSAST